MYQTQNHWPVAGPEPQIGQAPPGEAGSSRFQSYEETMMLALVGRGKLPRTLCGQYIQQLRRQKP